MTGKESCDDGSVEKRFRDRGGGGCSGIRRPADICTDKRRENGQRNEQLTGLTPVASEAVKPPTFKEANLVLECRTLYRQPMTEASFIDRAPFEKWYSSAADLHIVYIAEVLAVRQAK